MKNYIALYHNSSDTTPPYISVRIEGMLGGLDCFMLSCFSAFAVLLSLHLHTLECILVMFIFLLSLPAGACMMLEVNFAITEQQIVCLHRLLQ